MKGGDNSYGSMGALLGFAITTIAGLSGCGGGGGGGGGGDDYGFYAGTWSFRGVKLVDSCNTSVPSTVAAQHIVNQDQTYVVLDSGSLTYTGIINANDGFDVSLKRDESNNCKSASILTYEDAGDNHAKAILAIVMQCGDRSCSLGYAGDSTRAVSRAATLSTDEEQRDRDPETTQSLQEAIQSGKGAESSLEDELQVVHEAMRAAQG